MTDVDGLQGRSGDHEHGYGVEALALRCGRESSLRAWGQRLLQLVGVVLGV